MIRGMFRHRFYAHFLRKLGFEMVILPKQFSGNQNEVGRIMIAVCLPPSVGADGESVSILKYLRRLWLIIYISEG